MKNLSMENLMYQLAITFIKDIGSVSIKKLIAYCGSAEAVYKESKASLLKIPGIGDFNANRILNNDSFVRAEKELEFIKKNNIQPLFFLDKNYPYRLKNCIDAPMMLYFKGNQEFNCKRVISVVGTRNITDYGKIICENFIKELTNYNILVISGLAYGVDTCAHKSCVKNNIPTVGVLAHGLDNLYPSINSSLAEKMKEKGGLITEFPSETKIDPGYFPRRNRVIAGMSDATVVVESGQKGGSLITADIAFSYDRDVFAFPGKANDKYSRGCNYLIKKNKAALIENSEDFIYLMDWAKENPSRQMALDFDLENEEQIIFNLLRDYRKCSIDFLALHSQLSMNITTSTLLNLEFKGIVKNLPGKQFCLMK